MPRSRPGAACASKKIRPTAASRCVNRDAVLGRALSITVRIFLGYLVVAIALSGALWLHAGYKPIRYSVGGTVSNPSATSAERFVVDVIGHRRASWQDPLAVFIVVAGVGSGVALVISGIRQPVMA